MYSGGKFSLLLVGNVGVGKSSTGNTILGQDIFRVGHGFTSVTTTCSVRRTTRNGTTIEVVDLPDLFYERTHEEVAADLIQAVACVHPGPTAVLFLIRFGGLMREDVNAYERLKAFLDPNVTQHTIVLFTRGDILERSKMSIDNIMSTAPDHLRKVLDECGNRYVVFNNMADDKQPQVKQLIDMVRILSEAHGGKPYTCPKYGEVGEKMEKEIERRLEEVVKKEKVKRKKYVQELEEKTKQVQKDAEREKREFQRKEREHEEQMKKNEEERTRQLEAMKQQQLSAERIHQQEIQHRQKIEDLKMNQMKEMEKERIGKIEDLLQRQRKLLELHDKHLEAEREDWRRREEQYQTEILQLKDQIASPSKADKELATRVQKAEEELLKTKQDLEEKLKHVQLLEETLRQSRDEVKRLTEEFDEKESEMYHTKWEENKNSARLIKSLLDIINTRVEQVNPSAMQDAQLADIKRGVDEAKVLCELILARESVTSQSTKRDGDMTA